MKKIDTSTWKSYKIGGEDGLFDVTRPTARKQSEYDDGDVPFVASGTFNNGIQAFLKPHDEKDIDEGKCITISPVDGYAFFQENDFLGRGGAGSSIIILRNENLNRYNGKFIASIIRHLFSGWSYSNMGNKDIVKDSNIFLPSDSAGNPDWKYMEKTMIEYEKKAKDYIKELIKIGEVERNKIDMSKHRRFHLYDDDLFIIDSGTKLDRIKMSNNCPSINFVGRANANNGVTDYIDKIEGLEPYKEGLLTVSLGGEYLGSCFVQNKPFYTSQNVNVLIPKKEISYYCKQYIATMIFREGRLHYKAFIDELNRHMKTDFTIPLPVDENNSIDWDFMEKYMKKKEIEAKERIHILFE